jgi:hypothetical protein
MKLHFWNTLTAEISSLESQNKVQNLLLQETVRVLELEDNKDESIFLLNLIKEVLKLDAPDNVPQVESSNAEIIPEDLKNSLSEVTSGISTLLAESLKQIDEIKSAAVLAVDSTSIEMPVN